MTTPGGTYAVTDSFAGLITFYDKYGVKQPLEIAVPPAPGSPAGSTGLPAGLVLNNTSDFVIQKDGKSAPAVLLIDTLDGLVCGWTESVDPNPVIVVDNSTEAPFGASYTALTMARNRFDVARCRASRQSKVVWIDLSHKNPYLHVFRTRYYRLLPKRQFRRWTPLRAGQSQTLQRSASRLKMFQKYVESSNIA